MLFLLAVMPARSSTFSADTPVAFFGPQVDQHDVAVGAARDDVEAALGQRRGQRAGIVDDVLGVDLEVGPQRLAEGHRLGRR